MKNMEGIRSQKVGTISIFFCQVFKIKQMLITYFFMFKLLNKTTTIELQDLLLKIINKKNQKINYFIK